MGESAKLDPIWSELTGVERALTGHLYEASLPLGAGRAHRLLCDDGFNVSRATVSRMLSKFDSIGITEAVGRSGRTLTKWVRPEFERLARHRKRNDLIDGVFDRADRSELIDLLTLRKAIEREAVTIACERSVPHDHARLLDSVEAYRVHSETGEDFSADAIEFHLLLCRAAHGVTFSTVAETLYPEMNRLEPLTIAAARHANEKSRSNIEHAEIAKAIIVGDALLAEKLCADHFDRMIGWLTALSDSEFTKVVCDMKSESIA